jgi:hypothetical protein
LRGENYISENLRNNFFFFSRTGSEPCVVWVKSFGVLRMVIRSGRRVVVGRRLGVVIFMGLELALVPSAVALVLVQVGCGRTICGSAAALRMDAINVGALKTRRGVLRATGAASSASSPAPMCAAARSSTRRPTRPSRRRSGNALPHMFLGVAHFAFMSLPMPLQLCHDMK